MKRIFFASALVLGLAIMCSLGASNLAARQLPAQQLPKAEDILDKEAQAMGGKEANSKVKTFIMCANVAVEGHDIQVVVHYAGASKQCMEIFVEGVGSEKTVINGDKVWVTGDLTGDRILTGDEKTEALSKAKEFTEIFGRIGNWRTLYKNVSLLGEVQLDGKTAYKVSLTTQKGDLLTDYYDKVTGLLLQREAAVATPEGTVDMVFTFADFRKVDGITHAFTSTITSDDMEIVVTIESMAQNVAIPESLFVLPSGLKTQIGD